VRLETIAQGRIDWNDFAGRLGEAIRRERWAESVPAEQFDANGIKRRTRKLDRRIDAGVERVFSAPPSLTTRYTRGSSNFGRSEIGFARNSTMRNGKKKARIHVR
jgi:hypothetical protein